LDYQELLDASTMMYACALRIFQLRLLEKGSISFHQNNTEAWVTVVAKCTKQQRHVETKQVHPAFVSRVKEIVTRRSSGTDQILFPLWFKPAGNKYTKEQLHYEKLMKQCNLESSHVSQSSATHYARSDCERLKDARQWASKGQTARDLEVAHWVETCRENAAAAVLKLDVSRIKSHQTTGAPLPTFTIEDERNRFQVFRSVELQRAHILQHYAARQTRQPVRSARDDPDRLHAKSSEVVEVRVRCRDERTHVYKIVPKAAVPGYAFDGISIDDFSIHIETFYRKYPNSVYKLPAVLPRFL
jgi:hypothetical protein